MASSVHAHDYAYCNRPGLIDPIRYQPLIAHTAQVKYSWKDPLGDTSQKKASRCAVFVLWD